jgi:ribosomal protein S12 methylthiotransferase accessory factor YcaO
MSGVHITGPADPSGYAISMSADNNTMTINSGASIQMGGVTLTEDKLARMEAALEFIERFAAENEEARAVWTAIKAKKRILK